MTPISRSMELYERARKVTPGGIHSNIRYFEPNPIYFLSAKGSKLLNVDGVEYIDCVVDMGACILGHGHPEVVAAVRSQVENGLTCGVESELSVNVAEKLAEIVPCAESVRFSTTGTEAVAKSLMIARGYTGREKIVKVEGCYDGWYDSVAVSHTPDLEQAGPKSEPNPVPDTAGILEDAWRKTIIMPFNDVEVAERIIRRHKNEAAALILEPIMFNIGCATPREGYLEALREMTEANDVLLIFDEVISGFRLSPGGAQEYYGVTPDLATFAKAIANGFPLSAVAGREDIMKITQPGGKVGYGGLYNGSQSSLAACCATLDILADGHVQKYLNDVTDRLVAGFSEISQDLEIEVRMQGMAGQFGVYFTDHEVVDYRTAVTADSRIFKRFQNGLLRRKIYTLPLPLFHHGVSAAHSSDDIEIILQAMRESLREVKEASH